jgi:prepilin-type processing-associated H-X9-DG protein
MNVFMGPGTSASPLSTRRWYNCLTDILNGLPIENGFVFIDTHEDSIASGIFNVPADQGWNHFPGGRHNGAATLSFTDGHVICHKWQDPRTRQPVRNQVLYGVLQPGNRDMQWIRDRASAPKKMGAP